VVLVVCASLLGVDGHSSAALFCLLYSHKHATWIKTASEAGKRRITGTYAPELVAKRYASVCFCAAPLWVRI
jgi:hypothetical protein